MSSLAADPQAGALADANRILAAEGVLDAFGHVSARHETLADRFLLARSMAPALVAADDIGAYDFEGDPLHSDGHRPYLERFIHAAIYRARPDVQAIVHSHSPSVIPFGVTRHALRPLFHMCGFLGTGAAHFDTADHAGDTDLLIRNLPLGRQLADALGDKTVVLMRGHGATVVGATLRQAVYRAVYAEVNAKLQMQAEALGDVRFLSAQEARLASDACDTQVDRAWDLWKRRVDATAPFSRTAT